MGQIDFTVDISTKKAEKAIERIQKKLEKVSTALANLDKELNKARTIEIEFKMIKETKPWWAIWK